MFAHLRVLLGSVRQQLERAERRRLGVAGPQTVGALQATGLDDRDAHGHAVAGQSRGRSSCSRRALRHQRTPNGAAESSENATLFAFGSFFSRALLQLHHSSLGSVRIQHPAVDHGLRRRVLTPVHQQGLVLSVGRRRCVRCSSGTLPLQLGEAVIHRPDAGTTCACRHDTVVSLQKE